MICYQVFHSDILNLLSMADMWRSRAPPTPLDFDAIRAGTFAAERKGQAEAATNGNGSSNRHANGSDSQASGSTSTEKMLNGVASSTGSHSSAGLKDQRALSLQDNLELFVSRQVLCTLLRTLEQKT